MSLHRADSELAALNRNAGNKPRAVSKDLFSVVKKALAIADATDGSFDPTVGPLTQQWGFLWKDHRLPKPAELSHTLERVGHDFVKLDSGARTVAFARHGIVLDLNAIAKGFAVDCAIEYLRERGISNAMIRAGGDLRVIGAPPGQNTWSVQIEDPAKRGAHRSIQLRDAAISTSGSYENFFEVNGQRYSHLLNPRTGMPVRGVLACTVIARTCMESDAWATALFVHGLERSMAEFPNLTFRFVLDSGDVVTSKTFPTLQRDPISTDVLKP